MQEVKKHREAYFDAHRAAELLKTELSQREEVWQATMKDLKSAHARELDDLSAQLKHYHNLADSVASSTATRDLERKVSELTLRQNQLLAECQVCIFIIHHNAPHRHESSTEIVHC